MATAIEILDKTRRNFGRLVDSLTEQQLVEQPAGFGNTILWNVAHALVTQDLLVNGRAGLPHFHSTEFIDRYRKGTFAEKSNLDDLDYIKEQLHVTVEKAKEIWDDRDKHAYDPYETSYGFHLSSVEDAILFNNTHEALHLGYGMAQRKVLINL